MKFLIETDHKPLVPLLGTQELDKLPPTVLRFRLRLARFQYTITHVPGKHLYTAHALSRAPSTTVNNDARLQEETVNFLEVCITHLPASNKRVDEYRKAQANDPICSLATANTVGQTRTRLLQRSNPTGKHEVIQLCTRTLPYFTTDALLFLNLCKGRHSKRYTQVIKEVVFVPNPRYGGLGQHKPSTT